MKWGKWGTAHRATFRISPPGFKKQVSFGCLALAGGLIQEMDWPYAQCQLKSGYCGSNGRWGMHHNKSEECWLKCSSSCGWSALYYLSSVRKDYAFRSIYAAVHEPHVLACETVCANYCWNLLASSESLPTPSVVGAKTELTCYSYFRRVPWLLLWQGFAHVARNHNMYHVLTALLYNSHHTNL